MLVPSIGDIIAIQGLYLSIFSVSFSNISASNDHVTSSIYHMNLPCPTLFTSRWLHSSHWSAWKYQAMLIVSDLVILCDYIFTSLLVSFEPPRSAQFLMWHFPYFLMSTQRVDVLRTFWVVYSCFAQRFHLHSCRCGKTEKTSKFLQSTNSSVVKQWSRAVSAMVPVSFNLAFLTLLNTSYLSQASSVEAT